MKFQRGMVMRGLKSPVTVTLCLLFVTGCASTVTSNTARTAKEQMLVSNAVDQSLAKVDFKPLFGQKVFLEEKYLDCVDKQYVVGSVRHRVLRSGAQLMDKVDDADVVLELRSGGVGTDSTEQFLGTPEIALPGLLTVPEIRVAEKKSQFGYAKLGMVMYDAKSKAVLGDGGVALAQSDDNNYTLFGVGPFQNGSLREDVKRAQKDTPGMRARQLPTTVAFTAPSDGEASVRFASQTSEQ